MTESLKTVLLNYAFCSFAGGFLELIAPQKTKAILRTIVAVVIIFSIASPIAAGDFSLGEPNNIAAIEENARMDALMHTANLAERAVKEELRNILINLEINEYEIYVSTSVDEKENTVYLESVNVQVAKEFSHKIEGIYNAATGDYKAVLKVGVKNE